MGRFMIVVFGLACAWGAWANWGAGGELSGRAKHLAGPLTPLHAVKLGEMVRLEGRLVATAPLRPSRDRGEPCVAFHTRVVQVNEDTDSDGDSTYYRYTLFEEKRGPSHLLIASGGGKVAVPLALWTTFRGEPRRRTKQRPSYPGVTLAPPKKTRGSLDRYEVHEQCLGPGAWLFVAGRASKAWDGALAERQEVTLEARDPVTAIESAPALGGVELHLGGQGQLVGLLSRSAFWHRVGAVALGVLAVLLLGGLAAFEIFIRR